MSYEQRDASLKLIGTAAALLALGVAASIGVSAWWYHARYRGATGVTPGLSHRLFTHGPAAEPDIRRDWREIESAARERLHAYGWVDHGGGVARIPIERAMALVAQGVKPAPGPNEPGQVP
jgi:hypothetical protein